MSAQPTAGAMRAAKEYEYDLTDTAVIIDSETGVAELVSALSLLSNTLNKWNYHETNENYEALKAADDAARAILAKHAPEKE